jgi:tetratricopeptide (TPR) repeat protein
MRLAEIGMEIDRDMNKALGDYLESLNLREAIEKEPRTDDQGQGKQEQKDVLFNLGEAYMRVGATYFRLGDPKKAMEYFRKALRPHDELVRKFPDVPDYKQNLARTHLAIAETSFRLADLPRARAEFADALETREQLFKLFDKNLFNKFELAGLLSMYGEFLVRDDKPQEAMPHLERAAKLFGELRSLDEKNVLYQRELGLALYRLGACALRAGDEAASADYYRKCREVRDHLANLDGADNARRRIELMLVLPHVGDVDDATPMAEAFLDDDKADAELLVEVARCYAQCAGALAESDPERAARYRGKAVETLKQAITRGFKDRVYLDHEVDLDPLRDDPAFNAVLTFLGDTPKPPPAPGQDAPARGAE